MRFGLHYNFESTTSRWAESYAECMRQIITAESYGFDSVLSAEHHFKPSGILPSPFLICGAIAARTKKIRVGPGVLLLPLHHPVDVAEQACVLDVLSNGRAILGVGLGNTPEEFKGFGLDMSRRAKRMEEGLVCLRQLFRYQSVNFSGEFYSLGNITITPRPVNACGPPIWIGAEKSVAAVQRAARHGDAWLISPLIPKGLLSKYVNVYNETLTSLGRNLNSVARPMRKDVYVSKNPDLAWAEAEQGIVNQYYNGYLKWGAILDDEGQLLKYEQVDREDFIELIQKRIIVGGPDDLIGEAEKLGSQYGITDLILRIQFPGLEYKKAQAAIELIGRQVIPHFS